MPVHEGRWSPGHERRKSSSSGQGVFRHRGFTLLEILLAVALIGLLSATLISTSMHLVGDRPMTPDEVFWQASREARQAALKTEHEQRLSFDAKETNFVLTDGVATQTFPVPPLRDLTVDFLPVRRDRNSVLIGGQLVDTQGIPWVSFYSDGTCMPFRVQIRTGGSARYITIDPWTCAPVLAAADATP